MLDMLLEQVRMIKKKQNHAVVTVVEVTGKSSCRPGSRMLVYPDKSSAGSIDNEPVELLIIEDAVQSIKNNEKLLKEYMSGTGKITVFIEPWCVRPRLVILGAGHVGSAVLSLGQIIGFDVTVIDSQELSLIREAADMAGRFIAVEDFTAGLEKLELASGAFCVICTFGHRYDADALKWVLKQNAEYIGMMGAKEKIAIMFDKLRQEGISDEQIDSVHSPIGLDLGGDKPEEIALCILAEIQQLRYKRTGESHYKSR